MALDEFWRNVKIAASLLWPDVQTDARDLDPDRLARRLRNAALWLTPAVMEGFDPDDFEFLSPSEREELRKSVDGFRRVAGTVPDRGPATEEQIVEAWGKLRRILEILQPDRNPDVDYFRRAKILENLRLPYNVRDDVVRIIHRFDIDYTGEPGVWVWVILKDEAAKKPTSFQDKREISRFIDSALRRQKIPLSVYVFFRTASEQDDLDRGRLR